MVQATGKVVDEPPLDDHNSSSVSSSLERLELRHVVNVDNPQRGPCGSDVRPSEAGPAALALEERLCYHEGQPATVCQILVRGAVRHQH